ncbi:hypothetical protein DACRYDRAFT_104751 [Dacryopinax primogenitus]|uniref:Regulator of volume decrease after cellular swelling-domain-containing protein n=1 Tax=Dacryopinax primogenitus (strain DJM 731) TaxID=1858805 RepID=M5G7X4_DACPD|nr:uncharacterized protein DACRYDRAFT_104751 [Dacryopinax primogenitus]EJU04859.1 hypothetical protein DACRYDRAFT_104751 [Dacryopinax primogenitus]
MPTVSVSAAPSYITLQEHHNLTSSTPDSFDSIPPVLRHKEDNVSITLDPPLSGLEGENIKGTLYVIESVLVFISTSGSGFQIDYPSITLHAVKRTPSGPAIYCQLDETPAGQPLPEDEDSEMRELLITPESEDSVERIFEALSICAALHPDKNSGDNDEMEDEMFADADESRFETFTGGEEEELSEVGRAALEHLESIIVYPPGMEPPATGRTTRINGAVERETVGGEETHHTQAGDHPDGTR